VVQVKKIRVLIADDFKMLRDVIRLYLGRENDMEVVGEAPELHEAVERARELLPDSILVNDYLPPVDSALATAIFREQGVVAPILCISLKLEFELIDRALHKGVDGFLEKDEIDQYLVKAVRSVYQGKRFFSPRAREVYGPEE
jgi:DNA-binding NarL/FixJ family response regulator